MEITNKRMQFKTLSKSDAKNISDLLRQVMNNDLKIRKVYHTYPDKRNVIVEYKKKERS